MLARDVMTTPVLTVRPDTAVQKIAELLLECRISAVPVVDEGGRVCGMVSEGDLVNRADAGTRHRRSWWLEVLKTPEDRSREFLRVHGQRAEDVMTRDVVTVEDDAPLPAIAATLEKHRVKRVPVLRGGKLVGIVSRANLLQALAVGVPFPATVQSDRDIREALNRALSEAGLPMHQASVTVTDGVVRLWGWIDAEVQRRAARAAVESIPGVRGFEDNLVVTTPAMRAGQGGYV
jgi:CBS domain-containing protein